VIEKKTGHNPAPNPEHALAAELRGIVAPELAELAAQAAPKLLVDQSFERGRAMYHRLVAAWQKDDPTLTQAREDFVLFAKAHVLKVSGRTPAEVADLLQTKRVIPWVRSGQVPEVLCDNDPIRGALFAKRMSVPKGASPEFAYLLGAYAGTRRLGATAVALRFSAGEEQLIERLTKATFDSCGISLSRHLHKRHGIQRMEALSHAQELVEYLHTISQGNAVVPWKHLQTSAERREFIRGFLDFSGASFSAERHRLTVARKNNPALLEEIAIVLKREGVLARVSRGRLPSLSVESTHGLERVRDLELVTAERLRTPLKTALTTNPNWVTGRPEQYEAVMEVARRLSRRGTVKIEDIRRILRMEGKGAAELPVHTIRHWALEGHVPVSVMRLRENEALEQKLFDGPRLLQIGLAIQARLDGYKSPRRVTSAIAEYLGDFDALVRRSQLPKWIVNEIASGERLPNPAEYRFILSTVGLPLSGELKQEMTAPTAPDVEGWIKSESERRIFLSFQAALCRLAQEAFLKGEDPRAAVRQRVGSLMRKTPPRAVEEWE
jgi:hypothetical protein